jgi:hypothetical protein
MIAVIIAYEHFVFTASYRSENELAAQATRVTGAMGKVHHVQLVMGYIAGGKEMVSSSQEEF